jgi:hypothetical protein
MEVTRRGGCPWEEHNRRDGTSKWGSVRGRDVSWWPDSDPRERGECHEEGCYRGEPGHGYVTMSGEVQGRGRAGGPCEG